VHQNFSFSNCYAADQVPCICSFYVPPIYSTSQVCQNASISLKINVVSWHTATYNNSQPGYTFQNAHSTYAVKGHGNPRTKVKMLKICILTGMLA
jgi:hypothetical protein